MKLSPKTNCYDYEIFRKKCQNLSQLLFLFFTFVWTTVALMLGSLFFVLLLFFRRLFSSVPLLAKLN